MIPPLHGVCNAFDDASGGERLLRYFCHSSQEPSEPGE